MAAVALLATRRTRGVPCAPPCPWCGAEGEQGVPEGASLSPEVTLYVGLPVARVGAWRALGEPSGELSVVVGGSALEAGLVVPTAMRLRPADAAREASGALWRGAPLVGTRGVGGRVLTARWTAPGRGDAPGSVAVVELVGLVPREGEGEVTLRVVASPGGCTEHRVRVRVLKGVSGPRWLGTYAALEGPPSVMAGALARWADGVVGALVAASGEGLPWLRGRALRASGEGLSGAVSVGLRGLGGGWWDRALRLAARGALVEAVLEHPWEGELAGLAVSLGTRGRPGVTELSAWRAREGLEARRADGLLAAWEAATRALGPAVLQGVVGGWEDRVFPGVLTPWERALGVRDAPDGAAWLGTWLRAPGAWGLRRGEEARGEALTPWWPGASRGVSGRSLGCGARSPAVRALLRRTGGG